MAEAMTLEDRLRRVEDIDSIRGVLADYCHFFDTGWDGAGRDAAKMAALFTEDGVWDGGTAGRHAGRAVIEEWCATYGHTAEMSVHIMMNPKITVEGEKAHGAWTGLIPMVTPNGEALWIGGRYICDLVRTEGGWKIALMQFKTAFQTPYEQGFGKVRIFVSESYATAD